MTKLHRKELKQDEIGEKIKGAVEGVAHHQMQMVYAITILLAIGIIAFAWSHYEKKQQQESQALLGAALEKLDAPVGEQPATETSRKPKYTYKTETEKYTEALKDLEKVQQQYGNTPAAAMARYQAGICAFYLKDIAKAEKYLQESGRANPKNILFCLSRIALANVYTSQAKYDPALKALNEATTQNQGAVPPESLMLQLAQTYEKAGKTKEANDTYQKIVKDYKDSSAGYEAQQRLNELKEKQ